MCSQWRVTTFFAESVGFFLSLISNAILLLVIRSTETQFGKYKYLMVSFSTLGVFYSCSNFWIRPSVHITNTTFVVFTNLKFSRLSKFFGSIAITINCCFYSMMLSVLAIHFFYRYTSVTAPQKLSTRFSKSTVLLWAALVLLYSTVWGCSTYFLCGPTELFDNELAPSFLNNHCLRPEEFAYVGPKYYFVGNSTDNLIFNVKSVIGVTIIFIQMAATLLCVAYFGIRTYCTLNKLGSICVVSKELQTQLFRTLVIQTLIPLVFLYMPVCCMFVFPILMLNAESITNIIPICLAIYPCLEPSVAMYIIKDFRQKIKGYITCAKCRPVKIGTHVATNTDNIRSEFNM